MLRLNAPVTTLSGYSLSTTNDIGKEHLMAGDGTTLQHHATAPRYGTTQVGSVNAATNWNDGSFGHHAYNTFDVTSRRPGPCCRPAQAAGCSGMRGSNLARFTLKKAFTLRTLASCVNRRCTSAW